MPDNKGAEFEPEELENGHAKKNNEENEVVKNGSAKEEEEVEIKDKKKEEQPTVGVIELFKYATCTEILLTILGLICALCHGLALPLLIVVFGDMTDLFINNVDLSEIYAEATANTSYTSVDLANNATLLDGLLTQRNLTERFQEVLDGLNDHMLKEMRKFSIYYTLLGLGVMVMAYGQVTFWLMAAFRQTRLIRIKLFRAILRQDIGWFDTHEPGELNTRIADDVTKIQDGIGDKLGNFCQWFASFVCGIVIGFVYGWKLTLVILAFGPLLVMSGAVMTKLTSAFTGKELDAYAKAGAVADEVLGAIRTVTAFNGQDKECARYNSNLGEAKTFGIKKGIVGGGGMGLVYFIIFCVYAAAFAYGSKLFFDGEYTAGNVLIVFFCVLIGAFSLGNAAPNLQNLGVARGAAFAVYNLIDRVPPIDNASEEGLKPESLMGEIEFTNVKFRYPARKEVQVLKGLNLKVTPGQTVALVGSSGCGKSTTIQLLQRFYDTEDGAVLIDGHNIKDLNLTWLRTHIGVVSQEPILFDTTIGENIRYGWDGVTQTEIEQAAKEANAYDFISKLPKKFETLVGERGAQLSGGQKQRIAIARALVRNPKILLLDEATSALDTESEAIVQSALDKARQGRTTLVIAHRLSTIRTADVIAGFDGGVIIEQGTHEELMQNPGVYNTLFTTQTRNNQNEEEQDEEIIEATASPMKRRESRRESMKRKLSKVRSMSVSSENEEEEEEKLEDPDMMRIFRMNAPEWCYMLFGSISALIGGAVQPAFAIIFAEILGVFAEVDKVKGRREALMFSYLFFAIGIIQGGTMLLQGLLFAISGENLTIRIREQTFRTLLRQEIGFFDEPKNSTGSLTTRLAVDAGAIQGATGARMGTMFQSLGGIGTGLIIGFIYSWKLTLCVLAFVPFIMAAGMLQMKILAGYSQDGNKALEESGKIASEAISNIRTVATLSKEEAFSENYSKSTQGPYKKSILQANLNGIAFGFAQALIFFAYAACFYLGAYLISQGELTFENLFRVFSAIVFGAMAAGQTSHFAPDYGKAKVAATRIFRLLDRVPSIDVYSTAGKQLSDVSGSIEFAGLEFNYPTRPSVKILQGLNLTAESGQTVALVGSSGCGKSTTIQLMERFYDPLAGSVKLDGNDIKDLNLQWLRTQISLVSQEPILFDCSIKENIQYGDNSREVSMDEVIKATKNANIHEFISNLPQGYDTPVGDKGTQLSGGQKQRIAIARALVRNPKILLLDEATSALDTESEKVVQDALDKAQEGRTSIVIAHRLSTIQNANKIAVVSNGNIVELGTHTELAALKGFYYKLNQAQLKRH